MSKRSVLAIGHGSPTKVAEDFLSEILLSDNKVHFKIHRSHETFQDPHQGPGRKRRLSDLVSHR